MQMPETEEEAQTPSLDDDGFESLDGNGSCDSNKEEQDISFTAEEYETVVKNSPVHDSNDNGLVILKSCPKYKQNDINLSICCCKSNGDDCEVANVDKQCVDETVEILVTDDKNIGHNCSLEMNCVPCAVKMEEFAKGTMSLYIRCKRTVK